MSAWRLSADEIARVRVDHPIGDVLRRAGVDVPGTGDVMICCPTPGHEDSTPSCMIHAGSGRFYCFGCGAHGDVFALVRELTGITSLAQAAELLDSGGLIVWSPSAAVRPVVVRATTRLDQPVLDRTPLQRILEVNDAAWRYVTCDRLADQARAYLARRGLDLWPLDARTCAPLVGYTPADRRGLSAHLTRRGFTIEEILDAGWAIRRDGGLVDRFHRRVLFPVRDSEGRVAGVIGRDVTDHARQKYLNTAHTIAYRKGELLYRPLPDASSRTTVIVCEGPLDALAIAASSPRLSAVAPSGTALTTRQAELITALRARDVIVCTDADAAGTVAGAKWQATLRAAGNTSRLIRLPDGHDPASYAQHHGPDALAALLGGGAQPATRPQHIPSPGHNSIPA